MRLLLIEDDHLISKTLCEALRYAYVIDVAASGKEGEEFAHTNEYDVILLDFNLPDMNGAQICSNFRQQNIQTPILMLTGRSQIHDKVTALDAGADDYVTKPFDITELKARMRAVLRRNPSLLHTTVLSVDDLYLDLAQCTVWRGNQDIVLRRKEFQLLEYLVRNKGRTLTRSMIIEHIWESARDVTENTIDVHMKHLRDLIDKGSSHKLIKTIYGLGYKIG
jgi:DNA-binding response OmpR family regulator